MKEARFWKPVVGGKVECTACARRCKISDGSHGFCFLRQNRGGKLYLANYGKLTAMQLDPIEKKPFNHFMPGSYVFGVGTPSCNFDCAFCQNPEMSKEHRDLGVDVPPEDAVRLAIENGAQGMAYTYNEPTIFMEYALDTARIAHEKGLFNVFVTNGYMTVEAVHSMCGLIDAAAVDFKGSGEQGFVRKYSAIQSSAPIREALLEMKKAGIHIEITDLVVPEAGDSRVACGELMEWVCEKLGHDTPVQFTRFHPDYKMLDLPETPYETLKEHYDIARGKGLDYVYIGNVPGNQYESTYCPVCGDIAIERRGFQVTEWHLDKLNQCATCGRHIPITGTFHKG